MDRRNFLLTGCKACAAMAALPATPSLESCSSTKSATMAVENGVVTVPMSMLANGSAVVNANGLADKILVTKNASGEFKALVLNCTHKGGPVKQSGTELSCSWHGSKFDLNGNVVNGPAKDALKSYPVEVAGQELEGEGGVGRIRVLTSRSSVVGDDHGRLAHGQLTTDTFPSPPPATFGRLTAVR